jgi:hypothetical protein
MDCRRGQRAYFGLSLLKTFPYFSAEGSLLPDEGTPRGSAGWERAEGSSLKSGLSGTSQRGLSVKYGRVFVTSHEAPCLLGRHASSRGSENLAQGMPWSVARVGRVVSRDRANPSEIFWLLPSLPGRKHTVLAVRLGACSHTIGLTALNCLLLASGTANNSRSQPPVSSV